MMMTNIMQSLYAKVTHSLRNQRGAQAIEWIALAGVILAVFAAIQTVFDGDTAVGKAVSETLSNIIGKLD
ncbi:hypothetical protein BCE02nite_15200 [Brevibacillus centrosporus]|jgi:Flp pilus assembly pilin Flp|uniref:Pilus assembly protein Flp/PilA n=2 Tax=Brevibacillus TaxID=55080 RepID=A0A1I3RGP8_9BACL|nr:hypothetical protein BCE02nite_15200 [Brevibacillus centrosporus]SFJ45448.1 hypothetical protein SAMN05518846_103420 [Brevibacillus centrosporus]